MGNPTIKKMNSWDIYLRIMKFVYPYWKHLLASSFCAIMYSVFSGISIYLIIPFLQSLFSGKPALEVNSSQSTGFFDSLKNSFNEMINNFVMSNDQMDSLFRICVIVLIGFLFRNLFQYLQSYTMAYLEQGVMKDIRDDLFEHLHNLYLGYFTSERAGNLISRVTNDVLIINSGISASFVTLIKEPFLIIIFLLMSIAISWQLTVISILVFPFALIIISWIGLKLHKESGILQQKMADITSVLQESIFGVKIVKAFAMEDFENKKFRKETGKYFKTILKMTRIRNMSSPLTELLSVIAAVFIIWYGGRQVLVEHTMGASEFLGFFIIVFQLMPPIKELSTVHNRIQEATAAGKRVFEILDTEPQIKNIDAPIILNDFKDSIEFKNVSFAYDSEKSDNDLVLKNLNLLVKKGEILAIVGPSGAGKSTLIDLIPRFYDPNGGVITLDDNPLKEIEIKSLRSNIGIVTQETILFNDTIKNNIAYGLEKCSEEKIFTAAKAANAHNFIMETSEGYETIIGDRGIKLSGGQRQRLSIARALLKDPPIMILDEATSALDSESELLVQEAIERLMLNRTTFVIAHRLSTIRNADRIIVIDKGEIIQTGKHEDLIQIDGMYKKLSDMQFRL